MTCRKRHCFCLTVFICWSFFAVARQSRGDEDPYFITYSQFMEEQGDLDVGIDAVHGKPTHGPNFLGSRTEFEYGIADWWTSEFYLDGQWTQDQSAIYTGFRIENRFRPFSGNHFVNPVLYIEYEHINEADKTLHEIVGFDSEQDNAVPNDIARREQEHEIETRLIIGSDFGVWNLAGNFIAEKNLSNEPWEFGYAAGISRPITSAGRLHAFQMGVEFYGGLGDWNRFTMRDTSQYLGACFAWKLRPGPLIRVSPAFGLTEQSHGFLLRFGISQEVSHIDRHIRSLF